MRIYTREKKPKLYSLIFITLAAFALSAFFFFVPLGLPGGKLLYVNIVVTLYLLTVLIVLAVSLIRQLMYNPYSYNTIYYSAFSLFVLSVLATHFYSLFRALISSTPYSTAEMFATFKNATSFYIQLSVPFFVIFCLGMIVSNLVLIKKEGISFSNILGILVSLAVLACDALLLVYKFVIKSDSFVIDLFFEAFFYVECMMIGTIFASLFAALHVPEYDKDYIIILGCRIRNDGEPTPLLRSRIDRALAFADKQESISGKTASFICSGGKGSDEPVSEAQSMAAYLLSKNVRRDRIILEDRSTSTLENLRYSLDKVPERSKVAFSTTNYHVFRSGIAANRVRKFSAEGMGASTKWYFWPNASVREFAGLVTAHIGKQILVFLGIMLLFFLFTFTGQLFV